MAATPTGETLLQLFNTVSDLDHISKPAPLVEYYERELAHLRGKPINVVEVGNYKGHFLRALDQWLGGARLIGLDVLDRISVPLGPRVSTFICNQGDCAAIGSILAEHMPEGIDVLIDDASHIGSWSKSLFDCVFDRWMKPGGLYYVEDWQTGYWPHWPDGASYAPPEQFDPQPTYYWRRIASHDAGMVGYVKTLIDKLPRQDGIPRSDETLEDVCFTAGVVRLRKRAAGSPDAVGHGS